MILSDRTGLTHLLGFLSLLTVTTLSAGTVEVSLSGIDSLSVIIKGVIADQQAASINVWVYYRDDATTDLAVGDVNSSAISTGFGWGTAFETKAIENGPWLKGGHTFSRRATYANLNLEGPYDDYWSTGGVTALSLDFAPAGSGERVPTGVYICRTAAGVYTDVKKMIFTK